MHHAQPSLGSGQGLAEEACYTHTQLTSHARKRFNERTTRKRPILLTHFICSPWCVKEEESLLQLGCAGPPFQLYWLTRVTVLAALKIWQPLQVKWDSSRGFSNIMTTVLHTFVPHASHNQERILSCQWKNGRNIFFCLLLSFSRWIFRSPDAASVYGRRQG